MGGRGSVIGWGIVGTARIAEQAFLPAVRALGQSAVQAVASRDRDRAQAFANRHGIPRAYGDYDELLRDADVHLVYIPLPNSLHARWVCAALEAGKWVLVEKPALTSPEEIADVARAQRRTGLPVYEAFVYRYHPQTAKVKEVLAAGRIGAVRQAVATFRFALPDDPANVRLSYALRGGALWDIGCYTVSLIRQYLGSLPQRVAVTGRVSPRYAVETAVSGVLEYAGGATGLFAANFEGPGGSFLRLEGEKGLIELSQPTHPRPGEAKIRVLTASGAEEVAVEAPLPLFAYQIQEIERAYARGQAGPGDFEDIVDQTRALVACARSLASGSWWPVR